MYNNFTFYNPVRLYFGAGALEELATIELPGKKALVVTTPEKFYVDRVGALLEKNGVEWVGWHEVRPNPTNTGVDTCAQFGLDNGCDFLLAIGGGSAIDTAKNAAVVMKNGGKIWDYIGDGKPFDKGAMPIVTVCTTSGTGSEADQGAVCQNDETHAKMDLFNDCIFPAISIVDGSLMCSLPKTLTAAQGMDAIYHAMEGYLGAYNSPMADMYARDAIRYASEGLVRCYRNGNDLEARCMMAYAATMAGVNESVAGTSSIHAISHAFASYHPTIPHGIALSIVAVECLKHYIQFVPERFEALSELVGYGKRAEGFIDFIEDTLKKVDLYDIDYAKYGITIDMAEQYADNAFEHLLGYIEAEVKPMSKEEMVEIIKRSLSK